MKLFKMCNIKESGFSLIETMVGGAILAGVGIAGSFMFGERFKNQAQIESLVELETYHKALTRNLQMTGNCNATLSASSGSATVPSSDIQRIWFCASNCSDEFKASQVVREGTPRLTESLANPVDGTQWINSKKKWEVTELKFNVPATRTGILNLSVTYTLNKNTPTPKEVYKTIPLNVKFTSSAPYSFITCGSDKEANIRTLVMDMCDTIGSSSTSGKAVAWNDSAQQCLPITSPYPKDCNLYHTMMTGIDVNGNSLCKSITVGVDTNAVVDKSDASCAGGAHPVLFINTNGKLKVRCDGGCTPVTSCATIAAGICPSTNAGSDSCGTACGMGTLVPTPSCATIKAGVCNTVNAGSDSCGTACGMGTKTSGCPGSCTTLAACATDAECGNIVGACQNYYYEYRVRNVTCPDSYTGLLYIANGVTPQSQCGGQLNGGESCIGFCATGSPVYSTPSMSDPSPGHGSAFGFTSCNDATLAPVCGDLYGKACRCP